MRCGEQWALAPSAVAPPASPPPAGPGLPAGNYYIQSAGRAGEGNAACATYLGYGACGTGTGIGEMANTNPGVVTWAVAPVAGVAGAYTIVAGGRRRATRPRSWARRRAPPAPTPPPWRPPTTAPAPRRAPGACLL